VLLACLAGGVLPLSTAATAAPGVFQSVPSTTWDHPGTAPLDGVGGWIYLAAMHLPAPTDPGRGYVYGQHFTFASGAGSGMIGLSWDANGGVAGLALTASGGAASPAPLVVAYDWLPTRFYYLFTKHLGNGLWGAWVFDGGADPAKIGQGSWTYLGAVQAPDGWGLLGPGVDTTIGGAQGAVQPPFAPGPASPATACTDFNRVDAWFAPPDGFRNGTASTVQQGATVMSVGACASTSAVQGGWLHDHLGLGDVPNLQPPVLPTWQFPGEPLDGVGGWVYVSPTPAPGPGQLSNAWYEYGIGFAATGAHGEVALAADDQGPVAALWVADGWGNPAPVTIRYPWQRGHFYYLYAAHQGGGRWAAAVFDLASGTWTYIGQVQAPATATTAGTTVWNEINGAVGTPVPAFSSSGQAGVDSCSQFPLTDAWFSPVDGFRAGATVSSTLQWMAMSFGDCPISTEVQNGWAHVMLGTAG
jgi:hypothetical protein